MGRAELHLLLRAQLASSPGTKYSLTASILGHHARTPRVGPGSSLLLGVTLRSRVQPIRNVIVADDLIFGGRSLGVYLIEGVSLLSLPCQLSSAQAEQCCIIFNSH